MMMAAPKTPPSSQAGTAPEAGGIVLSAPLCRECSGYNTREGKKLAPSCEAFSAPGARADRGHGPKSRSQELEMTSPYLDRPLLPLAVALPRMLEEIEAQLTAARLAEKWRLRKRAELIRGLLTLGLGGDGHRSTRLGLR